MSIKNRIHNAEKQFNVNNCVCPKPPIAIVDELEQPSGTRETKTCPDCSKPYNVIYATFDFNSDVKVNSMQEM